MKAPMRMRDKAILRVVSRAFIPFILLFGLYVQFHGDFGPGGGFQAGVIFAAGLILYSLIFGLEPLKRVLPVRVIEVLMSVGVLLYAGTGVLAFVYGQNFLDYDIPLLGSHGQHYGILLVEAGVGLTVTTTMTMIYYGFAGRGDD